MEADIEKAENYRNITEDLVAEELDLQLRRLPDKLKDYISKAEVMAFALNRLPPLYATSEQGLRQQRFKAKREFADQITKAVRQALAAIQRDPLRVSTPLQAQARNSPMYALAELKRILLKDDLTWEDVADTVEQTLVSTARGDINWKRRIREDELSLGWGQNDDYYIS
jgi:hypothetical protein